MQDCIFCKIVAHELPSLTVYEDNDYLAFLDINPRTSGHTLVIPKRHYRWVYDVPEFGKYWEVAKKVTIATLKSLTPKYVSYLSFGTEVPHAHISVVPMYNFDEDISGRQKYEEEFMKSTAKKIIEAIEKS